MFYGYIGDSRTLNDVITGLLQGRSGHLELFVNRYYLSLGVENGLITSFNCDLDTFKKGNGNFYNILVYCVAEMLANPEGFFAFYETPASDVKKLPTPVSPDELTIQATIVRRELDEIMDKIISPYAIFRVTSKEKDVSFFEGKNIIEALFLSEDQAVGLLRKIKDLLVEGKLDIYEFREGDHSPEPEIDYVMEKVPLRKVNVITILDNLKTGQFSGIAKISSPTYTVNIFYSNGEVFALYPVNFDLFEFLLSPDRNAELSLLSLDGALVKFLALRYLSRPEINTVSSNFMEISKLFLGLSKYKRDALLLISEKKGDRYIIFKDGKMIASLQETEGRYNFSNSLRFEEPYFVSLYFYKKVENIASVVYLFMINEILSIFMKHSPSKINSMILREAVRYPFLVFSEGKFHLVSNPDEDEEIKLLNLLSFLLELSTQEIGPAKQEEELEFQLRPFKDIFRVLDVDKFLKKAV